MANIDFGDPIDFSSDSQGGDDSSFQRAASGMKARTPQTGPVSSIKREPAHVVRNVAPLFPRPTLSPQQGQVTNIPQQAQGMNPQEGFAPQAPSQAQVPAAFSAGPGSQKGGKKLLFVIIGVVVLSVLVVIGYFVFLNLGQDSANNATNTQANQVSQNTTTSNTNTTNSTPTVSDPTGDPDADALTNQEEANAGTDPNNPDSDGDTFKDGAEVEKGFNPLGEGKLPTPTGI